MSKPDTFGLVEDAGTNLCVMSKKRLHSPRSSEAAFAFQFHEDVTKLFGYAIVVNKEGAKLFNEGLTILKAHIRAYEQLKYEAITEAIKKEFEL